MHDQATNIEILRAGDGERVDSMQLGNRYLLEGPRSDGRVAVIEHTVAPHSVGAPRHTHANEDEFSYVLDGRLGLEIGGRAIDADAGDTVFKPRGVPHAFWNPGDSTVRLLKIISPGDFAGYFRDMALAFPDRAAMEAVRERYALDMDLASVPELVQRYGLRSPVVGPAD